MHENTRLLFNFYIENCKVLRVPQFYVCLVQCQKLIILTDFHSVRSPLQELMLLTD